MSDYRSRPLERQRELKIVVIDPTKPRDERNRKTFCDVVDDLHGCSWHSENEQPLSAIIDRINFAAFALPSTWLAARVLAAYQTASTDSSKLLYQSCKQLSYRFWGSLRIFWRAARNYQDGIGKASASQECSDQHHRASWQSDCVLCTQPIQMPRPCTSPTL